MSVSVDVGERRAERLEPLLAEREIDLLLVSDLLDLRYLTGFTGTNGLALAGPARRVFVTDFRYVEQAEEQVHGWDRIKGERDLVAALLAQLPEGELRLGFDDQHLTVAQHRKLAESVPAGVELLPAGGLIAKLRAVKEPEELRAIAAAAELADQAFATLPELGLAGRTERAVAFELGAELHRLGSEPSFPIIVASGAHGALPHAEPREIEIGAGELVVVDMGARLDGYCSDCTRTLASGEPGDEARAVYDIVLEAQLAALAAVRAGAGCVAVDGVAREIIEAAGHGEEFGHGLGHGVGLAVHEGPRLAPRAEGLLRTGNVVTVEPGVYVPGHFGVRIEDLVAVAEDRAEIYTQFPKELVIAG